MAAGISIIISRRVFNAQEVAAIAALHSAVMLVGLTLLFRSYKDDVDELRALADSVPNLVWVAEADGKITYVNKVFLDFSGKSCEQIRDYRLNDLLHSEDRERVANAWEGCTKTGVVFESEHRMLSAVGEYRWFLCRANPVIANGKVTRWYGVGFDITESKRVLENLSK